MVDYLLFLPHRPKRPAYRSWKVRLVGAFNKNNSHNKRSSTTMSGHTDNLWDDCEDTTNNRYAITKTRRNLFVVSNIVSGMERFIPTNISYIHVWTHCFNKNWQVASIGDQLSSIMAYRSSWNSSQSRTSPNWSGFIKSHNTLSMTSTYAVYHILLTSITYRRNPHAGHIVRCFSRVSIDHKL